MQDDARLPAGLEAVADAIVSWSHADGTLRMDVQADRLTHVCTALRDGCDLLFDYPADLCGRDDGEAIVLWYRLWSSARSESAEVTVRADRDVPCVPSVALLWRGMNWHEREVFDLYGVEFVGHPDQGDPATMRILLPEDWVGHPFRDDYRPVFSGSAVDGPQEPN